MEDVGGEGRNVFGKSAGGWKEQWRGGGEREGELGEAGNEGEREDGKKEEERVEEKNERWKGLRSVLSVHTAGPWILTVGYLEFRLNHPTEITREVGGGEEGEKGGDLRLKM